MEHTPVAEERVAVYIFMAEHNEHYGSQRARAAYNGLYAYQSIGLAMDPRKAVFWLCGGKEPPQNERAVA